MISGLLIVSMGAVAGWLVATLLALAALHAVWGLGMVWPAKTAGDLARMVVGRAGIRRMPPPVACFAVAVLLLALALWPLVAIGALPSPLPPGLMVPLGAATAAVFAARGVAPYLPAWRRLVPEEPFATLDRTRYGPLCLLIGAGFLCLVGVNVTAPVTP